MLLWSFWNSNYVKIRPSVYDDYVDRLNYSVTVVILIALSFMINGKQIFGQPIRCWTDASYPSNWIDFVESYCFVESTYFVPLNQTIPTHSKSKLKRINVAYYQWVPYVLLAQGLMFYLPHFLWKILHWQSGIDLKVVYELAKKCSSTDKNQGDGDGDEENKDAKKAIENLSNYVEDAISLQRDLLSYNQSCCAKRTKCWSWFCCVSGCCCGCGSRRAGGYGIYMSLTYLFVKLCYVVNVIGQFFILNRFLGFGSSYSCWGLQVTLDLAQGRQWKQSGHFPRITYCDFSAYITRLTLLPNTVQCVLMVNNFIEMFYLCLWWWFLFLAIVNSVNLFYWLSKLLLPSCRVELVRRYLHVLDSRARRASSSTSVDRRMLSRFTQNVLRPDGVLILWFIGWSVSDLVALRLMETLWSDFRKRVVLPPPSIAQQHGNFVVGKDNKEGFYEWTLM